MVNITDKVLVLSSVINLNNSNNISIIGHNNPTVICVNDSGLKMEYCNNVAIAGIAWIGCGATNTVYKYGKYDIYRKDIPVLAIANFSNLTLHKCSFHYSKGQVAHLTKVSGYVNINNCKFMNNKYVGLGALIYLLKRILLQYLTTILLILGQLYFQLIILMLFLKATQW